MVVAEGWVGGCSRVGGGSRMWLPRSAVAAAGATVQFGGWGALRSRDVEM